MKPRSLLAGLLVLLGTGVGAQVAEARELYVSLGGGRTVVHASHRGSFRVVRVVRGVRPRRHVHGPLCLRVPGRYETRVTRVFVPGYYREEVVPPEYEDLRDRYGVLHRVLIRPGTTRRIWMPGHRVVRTVRVWIPGRVVCL